MSDATAIARPLTAAPSAGGARHGLREVLGREAWARLPAAVRERFSDSTAGASYAGGFEIVRASFPGKLFAWLGKLVGTPVAPRAGTDVSARVLVRPSTAGVEWVREYTWADGKTDVVRSTKVVTPRGLVEKLAARLCMPLEVYEAGRVLHFVSRGYYFDLGLGLKLWLPAFFSPGRTHVEHIDLEHGWFRFTMTVTHPLFGEMFFQTGRFCATEDET